jgi:hypothetical protein
MGFLFGPGFESRQLHKVVMKVCENRLFSFYKTERNNLAQHIKEFMNRKPSTYVHNSLLSKIMLRGY